MTALLDTVADRGYPLVGAVSGHDADLPVARLGTGRGQVPGDDPGPLALDAGGPRHVRHTGPASRTSGRSRGAGPPCRSDDAAQIIAIIGRAHQTARDAGPLTWDEGPFRQWLARPDLYFYLAGDDGFAAYRWGGDGRHGELFVERVHAATPESLRALWSVIASHSSVARTVTALTAPNDPFWWLTTERDATITKRSMWMLRVVDAPAAIAARGFPPAVAAAVPLEINDSARPANSGTWQLEVADGKGALTPAAPSAARGSIPLTLGARGLAALYAGTPVATLRLAGLAAGGSPDTDAALDAAFAATPYMVDDF